MKIGWIRMFDACIMLYPDLNPSILQ
jgi:hypothetical protein